MSCRAGPSTLAAGKFRWCWRSTARMRGLPERPRCAARYAENSSARGRDAATRSFLDQFHFFLAVRLAIRAKDFVEPHGRLAVGVGMLPGIPRQISLRFSGHQAPIYGRHVIFFGDGKRALKGAAVSASHVFGADQRPMISL